tara:strand:+ start:16090 stop:16803 length:714 start_codon:yes stop_codon:yes gene_type:complete
VKNKLNYQSITFTNEGYIKYTENLLESIKHNQVNLNLKIFTLDNKSFDHFNKIHNQVELLDKNNEFGSFMDQKSEKFGKLMIKKFECIYKSLLDNENILYIDGDIVIKKNFINQLLERMNKNKLDFIFQNDKNPKKPNLINLCAGFMLINSNKKTIKFFNPDGLPIEKIANYRTHDQTYINKNRGKFKYEVLPLNRFPNGPYYYENSKSIDPSIIHFNFVLGDEKIALMKKYSEWYL